MTARSRLDPARCALVIVDVQEGFAPAIGGWDAIVERAVVLAATARLLDIPVVVTEQYPKGLGPTVAPVREALDGAEPLEKGDFPATAAEGFDLAGREQVVLCGVETHVCVLQSALSLLEAAVEVQIAVDATGTRNPVDRESALGRMELLGVVPTTAETFGFELLGSAGHGAFREFQEMIK